jgi:tRNA(Arg) A34 adenosine deaminase TadA
MKTEFMRAAIRLSLEKMRRGEGGPFGAVVVRQGKIVGRGWNRVTSTNDPTAHAEVMAIRETCRRLKTFRLDDCEIYASCEPCLMCLSAIYWARIRRIFYAGGRRDAAAAGFAPQNSDATAFACRRADSFQGMAGQAGQSPLLKAARPGFVAR